MQIPVMKEAASGETKNSVAPAKSSTTPNLPIGVAARIFPVLAVGVPSSFHNNFSFCLVEKKPGAIALTLIPTCEK